MILKNTTCILLLFSSLSCSTSKQTSPIQMSKIADNYLQEIVTILEANSIRKLSMDWIDFRAQVYSKAIDAMTIEDTYPAVRHALTLLDDNHSLFFKPKGDAMAGRRTTYCESTAVKKINIPPEVGYIRVNSFVGGDQEKSKQYASEMQLKIREQYESGVVGFIVDLRGNSGGNMWPMLVGIGPLLGTGEVGYFINAEDVKTPWVYENGVVKDGEHTVLRIPDYFQFQNPSPRVAVLHDNGTASSGEAIVVALAGRENTKSFGEPTCGVPTSNQGFSLSDGSMLLVTSSFMANRNSRKYESQIQPDYIATSDNIVDLAVGYLKGE